MFALHLLLLAQVEPTELDLLQQLFAAVTTKNWWLVTGLVVWLLVAVIKKWGSALPLVGGLLSRFLAQKWTPLFLAVLLSLAGGIVNLVAAGQKPTLSWFLSILGSAATAVFTQEVQKKALATGQLKAAEIKSINDADNFLNRK